MIEELLGAKIEFKLTKFFNPKVSRELISVQELEGEDDVATKHTVIVDLSQMQALRVQAFQTTQFNFDM